MRTLILLSFLLAIGLMFFLPMNMIVPEKTAQQPMPTPTIDRLALPVLSPHPSQVETGSSIYYYHCMPCHGDQGQGLTDEWRAVWEEDHQDCWASGCHSLRDADEVFTIPTVIPPVIGSIDLNNWLSKPDELFDYLKKTHPPQSPGLLKNDDYWALTAYLLAKNGVISPQEEVGPLEKLHTRNRILGVTAGLSTAGLVLILVLIMRKKNRYKRISND